MSAKEKLARGLKGIVSLWWLHLFGTALLLLLVGGYWFYHSQQEQLQQEVEANLTSIAQLKVDQIVAWRENQLTDANSLASNPLFRRGIDHFISVPHSEPHSDLIDLLNLIKQENQYSAVLFVNMEGDILLGADAADELPDDIDQFMESALLNDEAFLTDLHQHHGSLVENIHITAVVPVYSMVTQGVEPLGFLLLVTDAGELLYPLIDGWPVPSESAETLLIRQEGEEVVFLNNLRHQADTALSLKLPLSQTDLPAVMAVQGQTGFVLGNDYRDVEVAAVLLPIPNSSWFMVSKIDANEAFASWQIRSRMILATLFGMIITVSGSTLYFWQRSRKVHYRALYQAEAALRTSASRHDITLKAIGDGVIVTDAQGKIELLNPVAESLTGWRTVDAIGKPLADIFHILNEETRTAVENPVERVLRGGKIQGGANHTILVTRNGEERPITDSAAPILNEGGELSGVVVVFRDQSEERLQQRLTDLRISLNSSADENLLGAFLTYTLDKVGELVSSPIGFYHFVSSDQQSLTLQQWSTYTIEKYCHTMAEEKHYSVDEAGVWADCLRQKRAIIHNDYPAMENKNGMPEGHAELMRELVVPVMRGDKVVAILGVGNKPTPYTQNDLELVSTVADYSWQLVEKIEAEERLRENQHILANAEEAAEMGSWKWDLITRKLMWSEGLFRLFGVPSASFDGDLDKVIADRIHPDDQEAIQQANKLVLTEGRAQSFDYRIVLPDGNVRHVWAQSKLTVNEIGEPVTLTGYVQDITQRRKIEREQERLHFQIRKQADQMQKVLDAVPEGIILLDSKYQLLQANVAANEALNVLFLNSPIISLTHLGGSPIETLLTSPPDGLWHQVEADERIFEVNTRQLEHDPDLYGWVLVLRETTKQREFEEQLHRQERLAAVGKLAAGIAHDFNNLLAVIVLYAQLLQKKLTLDVKEKEQFEIIVQQANRAARLVQQILDFSRRSTMTKRPLELRVVLKEEVALLKRTLPENIDIDLIVDSQEFLVYADLTRIQQVIMNLAVNARDAMPQGGRLQLNLEKMTLDKVKNAPLPDMLPGQWIHLEISDDGVGIAPEIIDKIFDPFFTTKNPGEGTGLGLSQVHGIVAQHNGFMDVSSVLGKGSTFHIFLPQLEMDIRFSSEKTDGDFCYGSGQKVLVVEDEFALREALSEVIDQWHYEVFQAENGEQALALMAELGGDVDLIVTDLVMPKMGGASFVQALRQQGWEMPVIIMSGHPLDSDEDLLKRSGVFKVLSKPLNPIQLSQAIADALG